MIEESKLNCGIERKQKVRDLIHLIRGERETHKTQWQAFGMECFHFKIIVIVGRCKNEKNAAVVVFNFSLVDEIRLCIR